MRSMAPFPLHTPLFARQDVEDIIAKLKKYDASLDKEGTPMITMAGQV